jgi:SAM-dependent methyltransferase
MEHTAKQEDAERLQALHAEAREIWNANAGFWDDYMGAEGNAFHRDLVAPSAERLLQVRPEETVLEIACGAGLFARRLAELGARVVATDFSDVFLERARLRTADFADRIVLRNVDATDLDQLLSLGEESFDALVCNMAIMDIAVVDPLFAAAVRLLKPGGRFVFTICHPCFNSSGTARAAEQRDAEGKVETVHSIRVTRYRTLDVEMGLGVVGQPRPQYYFERTLATLLNAAFAQGLAMDGIEEPYFSPPGPDDKPLSMRRFEETPMVLAVRLRRRES